MGKIYMSYPVIDTPTEKFLTVQKESQNTTKIHLVDTSNNNNNNNNNEFLYRIEKPISV